MRQYIISDDAIQDLKEISDYFLKNNVEAGERLLKAFSQKCSYLVNFPNLGRSYAHVSPNLRGLPLNGFIIFYEVQETPENLRLDILRVVHGRRNLSDVFSNG